MVEELTPFSVPTTSVTVCVIQRDPLCNTSGLTAPGSINTCPMCEGQRGNFNVPVILLWYTGPPHVGLDPKKPAVLELRDYRRLFANFAQLRLNLPKRLLTEGNTNLNSA